MSEPITFDFSAVAQLEKSICESFPNGGKPIVEEVGGLLFGHPEHPEHVIFSERCWNASPDPRVGYSIEPITLDATVTSYEKRGWELLGSYHSHPLGPAEPSSADVVTAQATGLLLIVAPNPVRGWKWSLWDVEGREREVRIAWPHVRSDRATTLA